jgi:hypothetical protein
MPGAATKGDGVDIEAFRTPRRRFHQTIIGKMIKMVNIEIRDLKIELIEHTVKESPVECQKVGRYGAS